jgi:hypothetical protein
LDGRGGEEDGLKVEGLKVEGRRPKGRKAERLTREARIMNGRVLKLGALGGLAVNLFFRCFGKSKIQNQTSKIIPRGLRCFGKKRSAQVIRSGDLTVVSPRYPAQEGTIRSLLLIPPPAPSKVEREERRGL